MLKIGFVGPCYMDHGGTETWHQVLTAGLDPARFDCLGYAVERANGAAAKLACPLYVGREAQAWLAEHADVLVVWGYDRELFELPRPGFLLWVAHGAGFWTHLQAVAVAKIADGYVAVSHHAYDTIPESRRGTAWTIENGVVLPAPRWPRHVVRRVIGLTDADVMCLYVGRLSCEKRAALVAQAVPHLPPEFKLVIAGDGDERDDCYACGSRVHLLGPREDVADLLHAADLFVFPSEIEGFGLAPVEAMLANLPVLGTPVGVLKHRGDLARLVPVAAGPKRWALAIARDWVERDARARRAAHARAVATEHYTHGRFLRDWAALLDHCGVHARLARRARGAAAGVGA